MLYSVCVNDNRVHFLNGNLVNESELKISPRDLGFSRGYAVFDFLRTYQKHKPFKLREHVSRIFNSAEKIGLQLPWTKDQVTNWVIQTLSANPDKGEKFIKIYFSGGTSDSMFPLGEPTIIILVDPCLEYPKEWYEYGTGAITVKHARYNSSAKTNNYIEGVRQTILAKKIGALEPVYYSDFQVFEGSNSNVFAVMNGELVTPKSNILEGITRGTLLEILKLDLPIKVRDFTIEELKEASEIFMTGSAKEVVPVVKLDGKDVGEGVVGSVTKEVMKQFGDFTASGFW